MKKRFWIYLFIAVLVIHLIGILLSNEIAQVISKPLLIIVLIIYFSVATEKHKLKKWIFSALSFSWLGDILLMFQSQDSLFFLSGLSAFLIAHIFYIFFFHRVRIAESVKGRWWLILIVGIYYTSLIIILSPYLSDMKLPVKIYGIVISFMLLLAMHMSFIKNKKAGILMMTGALLFVISDSLLAINKFYQSFESAGIMVMLTYGLAQLFIIEGAIQYIRKR